MSEDAAAPNEPKSPADEDGEPEDSKDTGTSSVEGVKEPEETAEDTSGTGADALGEIEMAEDGADLDVAEGAAPAPAAKAEEGTGDGEGEGEGEGGGEGQDVADGGEPDVPLPPEDPDAPPDTDTSEQSEQSEQAEGLDPHVAEDVPAPAHMEESESESSNSEEEAEEAEEALQVIEKIAETVGETPAEILDELEEEAEDLEYLEEMDEGEDGEGGEGQGLDGLDAFDDEGEVVAEEGAIGEQPADINGTGTIATDATSYVASSPTVEVSFEIEPYLPGDWVGLYPFDAAYHDYDSDTVRVPHPSVDWEFLCGSRDCSVFPDDYSSGYEEEKSKLEVSREGYGSTLEFTDIESGKWKVFLLRDGQGGEGGSYLVIAESETFTVGDIDDEQFDVDTDLGEENNASVFNQEAQFSNGAVAGVTALLCIVVFFGIAWVMARKREARGHTVPSTELVEEGEWS